MALIDELKAKRRQRVGNWDARQGEVSGHQAALREIEADIADLDRAIAALEPAPTDEQSELFETEKAEAREQLEADHALPVAPDDVVLTDIGRWKYRVCWDGYGDRFGDSHHETLDEAREELKKRDTDVLVIAAALYEAYSDGEGGVLWREIQRFERPDDDVAADGCAPVNDGDRPALDADMRDDREQPVEAIGYLIGLEGESAELRSDGSVQPLTASEAAAPGPGWEADHWARKLISAIAIPKREKEDA